MVCFGICRDALFVTDSLELIDGPAETIALVSNEALRNRQERLRAVGMHACDLAQQGRDAVKTTFGQVADHFGFRVNSYQAAPEELHDRFAANDYRGIALIGRRPIHLAVGTKADVEFACRAEDHSAAAERHAFLSGKSVKHAEIG